MADSQLLPFYVVCDESASMQGEPVEAINQAIPELHRAIAVDPIVTDKTRFCLIGFSDTAKVLLPLSDLSEVSQMPALSADGSTNFGAAFTLLKRQIEQDVARLKADNAKVFRPAVFFMSDGQPTDSGWESAYQSLVDASFPQHPNVIAFGFGDADEAVIRKIATKAGYMADDGVSPGGALREWARQLTASIVGSASFSESEQPRLVLPPVTSGLREIDLDEV